MLLVAAFDVGFVRIYHDMSSEVLLDLNCTLNEAVFAGLAAQILSGMNIENRFNVDICRLARRCTWYYGFAIVYIVLTKLNGLDL